MKSLIPKNSIGYAMNPIGDWEVWDSGKFCGVFPTREEAKEEHDKIVKQKRLKILSDNSREDS